MLNEKAVHQVVFEVMHNTFVDSFRTGEADTYAVDNKEVIQDNQAWSDILEWTVKTYFEQSYSDQTKEALEVYSKYSNYSMEYLRWNFDILVDL